MSRQDRSAVSPKPSAESAIQAARVADLKSSAAKTARRVMVLTLAGIGILGWILLEVTTPLAAMGATFLAIYPTKVAVRRFLALESKRRQLLEGSNERIADEA